MLKTALYYTFIYPLESILNIFFTIFYEWCGSYGIAIVALSLLINLFLLRLMILTDDISKKHSLIKSKLDERISKFKQVFRGGELYVYIKTLYRQNHYHPIYALKALGGLAIQVPFFVAVIFLLEHHILDLEGRSFGPIRDLSTPDALLGGINLLPFLMTFFSLLNVFISSKERGARIQGGIIAFVFLIFLYKMPSALLLYWTTSMIFGLIKNLWIRYLGISLDIQRKYKEQKKTLLSKIGGYIFPRYCDYNPQEYHTYYYILIFAILNLCILAFVYNPFALYVTDITQFDSMEKFNTLGALFGYFAILSILLIYLISFFDKTRIFKIIIYGICVTLTIALIYNFILNYNVISGLGYGHLDKMIFSANRSVFVEPKKALILCDLIVGFFSCLFVLMCFYLKRFYVKGLQIIFCFFVFFSCFNFAKIIFNSSSSSISREKLKESNLKELLPKNTDKLLGFSKEKNVLILVLDGFTGSHFQDILDMYPDYFNVFDGFTYYDNVLSSSSFTFFTTASLIGGEQYTLNNLYKKYKKVIDMDTMLYEAHEAFKKTAIDFDTNGWSVDILNAGPTEFVVNSVAKGNTDWLLDKDIRFYYGAIFRDYYFAKKRQEYDLDFKQEGGFIGELASFGIFKMSPYSFRAITYDRGWKFVQDARERLLGEVLDFSSDVLSMSDLSNIQSKKPSFKYIKSMISHGPFGLDSQKGCVPIKNFKSLLPEKYAGFTPQDEDYPFHFDNEICAISGISSFLKWLKDEGIYNQTQIIIASDHDWADSYRQMQNNNGKILGYRSNPLLLVKDFNSTGRLKIDTQIMANFDAFLFFEKNLQKDKKELKFDKNRKLFHTEVDFNGNIKHIYEVQENVYDPQSWKNVTKEHLNKIQGK